MPALSVRQPMRTFVSRSRRSAQPRRLRFEAAADAHCLRIEIERLTDAALIGNSIL